jgi:hypothetical protein
MGPGKQKAEKPFNTKGLGFVYFDLGNEPFYSGLFSRIEARNRPKRPLNKALCINSK